ncbi:MAG: oligosaccharide flippase family protein [Chloroflexi bacterium]|nr:oligosaccharide flippase family protein [Chloroflexota bacterium]
MRVTKELFWIGLGQALVVLGGFVSIRVLTSSLGAQEYGVLALVQSLAYFSPQFLYGPLSQGVARFYAVARERDKQVELMTSAARLILIITVITGFAACLIALGTQPLLTSTFGRNWLGFLIAAGLLATIDGFSLTLDNVQNAARQRIVVSWHQNLSRWGRLGLAIVLVMTWRMGALSAVYGFVIASVFVALSQTWFLARLLGVKRSPWVRVDDNTVRAFSSQLVLYALPFALWGIFGWVQSASDRWALQAFWSSTEVGKYAVLVQIGYTPFVLLGNVMLQLVTPIVFEKVGDNTEDTRRKFGTRQLFRAVNIVGAITAISVLAGWLGHRLIFRLLTPSPFWTLSSLLPLVVLSAGMFNIGQLLTIVAQAFYQSRRLLAPKIAFAVLNTGLNIGLGRLYGPTGIVAALLLSSVFYVVWMALLTSGQLRAYS